MVAAGTGPFDIWVLTPRMRSRLLEVRPLTPQELLDVSIEEPGGSIGLAGLRPGRSLNGFRDSPKADVPSL
jgi:hypothetical protein